MMKKKIPIFKTDKQAEDFVATADLAGVQTLTVNEIHKLEGIISARRVAFPAHLRKTRRLPPVVSVVTITTWR